MTTYKAEYENTGNGINLIVNGQKRGNATEFGVTVPFADLEVYVNLTRRMNKAGVIDLETFKEWASGEVVKQFGEYVPVEQAQEGDQYSFRDYQVISENQDAATKELSQKMLDNGDMVTLQAFANTGYNLEVTEG